MELPLGTSTISVDLSEWQVTVADPAGSSTVAVPEAAATAVETPYGTPLRDLASPDDSVAVVVTDITRATPTNALVDVLLDELATAAVDREQVTVVVGLGLHRPMTDDELAEMLGEHADLAVNHDPDTTVTVGDVDGCAVDLYRAVAEADLVCSTGLVEPHQYAGFSGGAKTVVIGAGGEPLIRYTHGSEMLARDGVRLGQIEDNPFRDTVDRAGDVAGHAFCLNVTRGPEGYLGVSAGEQRRVVRDLAETAREALAVDVEQGYDAVIAGVGAPKDANLYQTTRAATYVVLGACNPLRSGGRIVLPAELSEGAGEGTGEQRFYDWLSEADSATSLYETMREGYDPGAQRAFVVARALRDHDVYIRL
jgi:nickel-dependent lactate racemase